MRQTLPATAFLLLALSSASSQWQRSVAPFEANVQQLIINDTVLVAWGDGGMFRSSDRGGTWSAVESLPLNIYVPTMLKTTKGYDAGRIWKFFTVGGDLYASSDTATFRWITASITWAVDDLGFDANVRLWAVADAGGAIFAAVSRLGDGYDELDRSLYVSQDGGRTWSDVAGDRLRGVNIYALQQAGDHLLVGTYHYGTWRRPLAQMAGTSSGIDVVLSPKASPALHVHPVPATDRATISFTLGESQHFRLGIFDARGHEVARLSDAWLDAGEHRLELGAGMLSPGIYYCRIEGDEIGSAVPLIVVR